MLLTDARLHINTKTINALNKKKLYTVNDVARFTPRRYKDYLTVTTLLNAKIGEDCAIRVHLSDYKIFSNVIPNYLLATFIDEESGEMLKVVWYGGKPILSYQKAILESMDGQNVIVCGKLTKHDTYGYQMISPDRIELSGGFIPYIMTIYPKISGVSEKTLKTLIYTCLKYIDEPLEDEMLKNKISYSKALYNLHYPKSFEEIEAGKERLLYNDLLYFSMKLQNEQVNKEEGFIFKACEKAVSFASNLPFEMTPDQKSACNSIILQARKGRRINMLLQGDVGCGKTIIAFIAMINAYENGYQSVLVAPTQILAEQHYLELKERLKDYPVEIAFLHSGLKASEKKKLLSKIISGECQLIVGTHSVFSKNVEFSNLGLICVDEEHRFGTEQKEILKNKAKGGCHVISMSATPVPRSLAGIYYGDDREICVVKSMPNGRIPIQTAIQVGHGNTFDFVLSQIKKGHQCYVVCPGIESKNDDSDEDNRLKIRNINTVLEEYKEFFDPHGVSIGVVHGKMKKGEITETIDRFLKNEIQILMSTTVIEVGVNVPNATVMVVEQADRFGLASLHQLRGRVGRNSLPSYCILITDHKDNERLKVMCETTNGFDIAEKDLELRGSGDLIGTKQSGFDKYVAKILSHPDFYETAKKDAAVCLTEGYGKALILLYSEKTTLETA